MMHFQRFTAVASLVIVAACSGKESSDAADTASQAATSTESDTASRDAAVAQQAGEGNSAPLSVADVDRWQKGLDAELKAVQEAGEKFKAAKSAEDSMNAMMAANDMSTLDAGAAAAGVSSERYKFIRSNLSSAAANLSPIEMEMPVKDMSPAMIEEMKKGREAALQRMSTDVPPDVIEALRPRAAALRKQDMELAGARLKAVGAGQ